MCTYASAASRLREVANLLFDSLGNNGQCLNGVQCEQVLTELLKEWRIDPTHGQKDCTSHRRASTGGRWPRAGWAGLERCSVRGRADHAMPFTLGAPTGRGTGSPAGGAAPLRPDADRPISAHMGCGVQDPTMWDAAPPLACHGTYAQPHVLPLYRRQRRVSLSVTESRDVGPGHAPCAGRTNVFLSSLNAPRRCVTIAS